MHSQTRTLRFVALAAAGLAVAACTPSIDPAAQAAVDRQLQGLEPSTEIHGAVEASGPRPFEEGQWARYQNVDGEGRPSILTYKVVGMSGDDVMLETVTESYYGRDVSLIVVDVGDRFDPSDDDIKRMLSKDSEGRVSEQPPGLVKMIGGGENSLLSKMMVRWDGLGREDARAIGGIFRGAYRGQVTAELLGFSATSDVWWHPAVPVTGMIRAVDAEHGSKTELLEFGDSGATSEILK